MITCKNHDDYDYLKSLRAHGWCRDISDNSKLYQKQEMHLKTVLLLLHLGIALGL